MNWLLFQLFAQCSSTRQLSWEVADFHFPTNTYNDLNSNFTMGEKDSLVLHRCFSQASMQHTMALNLKNKDADLIRQLLDQATTQVLVAPTHTNNPAAEGSVSEQLDSRPLHAGYR